MLRSLYTATTGMIVQRNKMDNITNNITNVDTTGYKKDSLLSRSFEDMLISRINDPNVISTRSTVGNHNLGVHIDEVITSFTQGTFEQTDLNTDLAISGDGFFMVSTPTGIRYTRAGNFTVDSQGFLVNSDGFYVLSNEGNNINVGDNEFGVNTNGDVTVNNETISTIAVVDFENVDGLRKEGNNLYYHYNNEAPIASNNFNIQQGFLEGSNVSIADEMVQMITTNRAYDSCQKAASLIDQSLGKTVNDIAKF